jgi:hypothetical protein
MVNNCANSRCGKPLHYLREGRIFIFDVSAGPSEPGAKRLRHLEHYWLCGGCSETMTMEQDDRAVIRVIPKLARILEPGEVAPVAASMRAF